jgi:hypothetical protein
MSSENKYYGNIIPITGGYIGQKEVLLIAADGIYIEDLSTTDKFVFRFSSGFKKMTTAERTGIASPEEGLAIYDTTLHKLFVYDGTTWQQTW